MKGSARRLRSQEASEGTAHSVRLTEKRNLLRCTHQWRLVVRKGKFPKQEKSTQRIGKLFTARKMHDKRRIRNRLMCIHQWQIVVVKGKFPNQEKRGGICRRNRTCPMRDGDNPSSLKHSPGGA